MNKKSIKSDLARIDRMRDADIDYSDIPALGKSFLKKAAVAWPPEKKQLTIRLDADVLAWLKAHGKGYQTRINRILRVVMESQPRRQAEQEPTGKHDGFHAGIEDPKNKTGTATLAVPVTRRRKEH
jgi:uncharacterized protein (DUF4415 family)